MRVYTVEEARAVLPRLIPILERLRDAASGLQRLQEAIAGDSARATTNGHLAVDAIADAPDRAESLRQQLSAAVTALKPFEIEVKDPARGLIDFYHERDGQLVYLCYLLGEPDIAYWHEIDAGFVGRQPL